MAYGIKEYLAAQPADTKGIAALFTDTVQSSRCADVQYQAIKVAENLNVAIYREGQIRQHRDDDVCAYVPFIQEFHLLEDDGSWAGPSATVHAPDLDYGSWDPVADAAVYEVNPGYASASSSSGKSLNIARATVLMLQIAADYAEALTAETTGFFDEYMAYRVKRDGQMKAKRVARQADWDATKARIIQATSPHWARITVKSGKVYAGTVTEGTMANLIVTGKAERTERVDVDMIERVEVKGANGRFFDVTPVKAVA